MTEHTPTPWQISGTRTVEDTAMIVGGKGFEFGLIADVTEDFDAAFIVMAVNNHDALVALLARWMDDDAPMDEQARVVEDTRALLSRVGGASRQGERS